MACIQDSRLTEREIVVDAKGPYVFLTHAHSDHIHGLGTTSKSHIYCTQVTKDLLQITHPHLKNSRFTVMTYDTTIHIFDVDVTCYPAYHCDGSAMFLFDVNGETILYTGDFRFNHEMRSMSRLVDEPLHTMYYDNTFANIEAKHVTNEEIDAMFQKHIKKHKKHKVYVHALRLGLEPMLRRSGLTFAISGNMPEERVAQLRYLLPGQIDPGSDIVLGSRKEDVHPHWIVPTCTSFLCNYKQDAAKDYVWYCTHPNQEEVARIQSCFGPTYTAGCAKHV